MSSTYPSRKKNVHLIRFRKCRSILFGSMELFKAKGDWTTCRRFYVLFKDLWCLRQLLITGVQFYWYVRIVCYSTNWFYYRETPFNTRSKFFFFSSLVLFWFVFWILDFMYKLSFRLYRGSTIVTKRYLPKLSLLLFIHTI